MFAVFLFFSVLGEMRVSWVGRYALDLLSLSFKEMLRDRSISEVSLSDPDVTISNNKRFLDNIQECNVASNDLLTFEILVNTVISGNFIFTPGKSRIVNSYLQIWKSHLHHNNFNFGASSGKLQKIASSFWKRKLKTISNTGSCAGNMLVNTTVSIGVS